MNLKALSTKFLLLFHQLLEISVHLIASLIPKLKKQLCSYIEKVVKVMINLEVLFIIKLKKTI